MQLDKLLHGGDYNPEQWLDRPDILAKDVELMEKAHVNVVTLGVFSWSTIEPQEGEFHLDWLADIIHNLYAHGISTILATPSAARPAWLARKYPEVRRVRGDRVRELYNRRQNHCYTSPIYREKVAIIDRKLAERFGDDPAVILWHIGNEFGGECHCELCQNAFRTWLQKRYGSLDALNKAWNATFWSHNYTEWSQIESPAPHGENAVQGLALDWKRFVSYQSIDFYKWERDCVRELAPKAEFTVNMMYRFNDINYFDFAKEIDVASWDNYPTWHKPTETIEETALDTAMMHDDGKITKAEYKRMARPVIVSSLIGVMVGIIPGTGASEASWFSYSQAKNMSKHPEEFGHGSVEGIAAAESANNAVTGATLIPLLTLGIPGDGTVAIMLSALMINGLNPGISLFTTDGDIMYAIMLGLILVNVFMFIQGKFLTTLFAKVVSIPQEILTPIIVIFCMAGAYSVNENYFDVAIALVFAVLAWVLRKLDLPAVPILLGMVLGSMTETNFRRALLISNGNPSIFFSSIYCWIFVVLIIFAVGTIVRGKLREGKAN